MGTRVPPLEYGKLFAKKFHQKKCHEWHIKIKGKSYWIKDLTLNLKAYGESRIIASKEGLYDEPIFLLTNAGSFSAKFVVQLYLKMFCIGLCRKKIA